jgi:nucleoid-associated protein YgaU
MKIRTQGQVEDLMLSIGCSELNARIFSAIAMCEAPHMQDGTAYSNFSARGDLDLQTEVWGPSVGGFQIRTLKAETGKGTIRDIEWLTDQPRHQAKAARQIKTGWGFKAWSTYTSGMYKAYLPELFPAAPGTYIVLGGDTLSKIAEKISAGAWTWQELAERNGILSPFTIRIGQILMLPTEDEVGA